uniref:Uncharacterized protein n=1 Tax=Anguilla anguilla TaxID=7936 RepID=A0A0E9XKA4_ANGAN
MEYFILEMCLFCHCPELNSAKDKKGKIIMLNVFWVVINHPWSLPPNPGVKINV